MTSKAPDASYGLRQRTGWVVGPAALLLTLLLPPPPGLSGEGWLTAGAAMLMAAFWIAESIPIPATALLPLVLFPALGLGNITETAAPFANPVIFLFLGGFILALAMQRWNLHRRVAIGLIGMLGTKPSSIIAGFLLGSALLSMWVSNTATSLMMLPIALSVVQLLPDRAHQTREVRGFSTALLLSIAYGATTGGMGTLIGTPPNALLVGYIANVYDVTIGFGQWMLLGVPVVLVALPAVYLVLTRIMFTLDARELPGMADLITAEKAAQGRMASGELAVAVVFVLTACCWVFRPLIAGAVPLVTDTTIAMAGALLLFMIPVDLRRGDFVMNWEATKELPWGVLLLFGGGLSLGRQHRAAWPGDLSRQPRDGSRRRAVDIHALRDLLRGAAADRVDEQHRHRRHVPADRRGAGGEPWSQPSAAHDSDRARGEQLVHASGWHAPERDHLRQRPHHAAADGEGRVPVEHLAGSHRGRVAAASRADDFRHRVGLRT